MKRNVDLSENRTFTTPEEPSGEAKLIFDWLKEKTRKPWDFKNQPMPISSDLDFNESCANNNEIIFTGNKLERAIKKQNHLYETGEVCDICGFDSRKKPWSTKSCDCYSMIYKPKMPWIF